MLGGGVHEDLKENASDCCASVDVEECKIGNQVIIERVEQYRKRSNDANVLQKDETVRDEDWERVLAHVHCVLSKQAADLTIHLQRRQERVVDIIVPMRWFDPQLALHPRGVA